MEKLTTDIFVKRAKEIHGNFYDYSKVEYVNFTTPVEIICPIHGSFFQKPKLHLSGRGCKLCGYKKNSEKHKKEKPVSQKEDKKEAKKKENVTTDSFISRSKEIHGNKYDYSKVNYVNYKTKVCIICPEHGEFWQTPSNHLFGKGCIKCGGRNEINEKEYDSLLKEKYNDISIISYNGYNKKSLFYCHKKDKNGMEHGEFEIVPHDMMDKRQKCSCPKCANEARYLAFAKSKEDFISEAKCIHGENRYDYSEVNYVNRGEKVKIICHNKDTNGVEHGAFFQTPANHLKARGCPLCKNDKLVYENKLYSVLLDIFSENEIIRQYRNEELGSLSLDFYIPKYKIAIEHQGEQHFHPVKLFGGVEKFNAQRENDIKKKEICEKNNVHLLYFSYEKYWIPKEYLGNIYTKINDLKNIIYEIIKTNGNE